MTFADLPSGTPWWIAIIMILAFGRPALGSAVAARIPGWLGAYGRRRQAKAAAAPAPSSSERVSRAEIDRIEADYKRLAAAREADRREFHQQIEDLKASVAELKANLTVANQRMWAAIASLRVHRAIVEEVAPDRLPEVPDKLKDLV